MWAIWYKIIVATGFEWLPKVQKIAQSGHTGGGTHLSVSIVKLVGLEVHN